MIRGHPGSIQTVNMICALEDSHRSYNHIRYEMSSGFLTWGFVEWWLGQSLTSRIDNSGMWKYEKHTCADVRYEMWICRKMTTTNDVFLLVDNLISYMVRCCKCKCVKWYDDLMTNEKWLDEKWLSDLVTYHHIIISWNVTTTCGQHDFLHGQML